MVKVSEVNNLLIVESENDKYFLQSLISHLNITNIQLGDTIYTIDEYECLNGIGELKKRLTKLKAKVSKEDIKKIGIIFDADDVGVEKRTTEIQKTIGKVFKNISDVDFSIYIMNVDGHGELETVLKTIKSKNSSIADCLDSWQECLNEDKKLTKKDFDKFWIQMYQRYDCCTKEEAKQAGKNCNNKASFSKNIYNLDNSILDELKTFLQELGE